MKTALNSSISELYAIILIHYHLILHKILQIRNSEVCIDLISHLIYLKRREIEPTINISVDTCHTRCYPY